ncbi:hypothetical protein FJM67_15545 [Maribrevibacterium harenarium]|uniref:Uncharacterized protein n=1 Tax=Maribrevibacterium harenarium TaxID=2589817 RepID=A0A501WEM1_9GAMM|nr:hypothetical protein [Maribrevibacterium harenarium]TPE46790.1 hypothetical protein FJM67_15545 [Maribrevibacterium harenarium]
MPNRTVDSQTYQIDQCRGLSDITTEARSDGSTTVRLFVATQQVNVNSDTDIRSEIMQMLFVMSQDESNSTWSAGSAGWDSAKNLDRDPVAAWEADRDRILDIELEQTSDNQYMLYIAKRHYAYGGVMSNRVFAYRYYAATNRSSDQGFRIFNNPWGNAAANWQVTDMEAIDGTLYVTSQSDGIAYANFANSSQDTTTPTAMTVPTAGQVCSGGIAWNGVAIADGNDARFYCGSAQDKKNVISVSISTLLDSESSNSGSESSDTGSGSVLPQ